MADRNTVIYGNQIKDATVTEDELNASVAGDGLSGGAGSPLAVNVDDSSIEINADTLRVKALGITNDMLAGSITDAKLDSDYIQTSEVDDTTIEFNGGTLNVVDGGIGNTQLTDDSILEAKLDVTNAPTDGYFLTYDNASGGFTWVESPATSGVQEADLAKDDFSATLNGALTDFDLTSLPVTASLQVFINGVLAQEGVGKDYELNPDSGQTKTIRINGDVLTAGEKLIAYYVINN